MQEGQHLRIVGLCGFAKSGKTTAAQALMALGGQEVAFAKHLKDVCSTVFGIPRTHLDDVLLKERPFREMFVPSIKSNDIAKILMYFEVPGRLIPDTIVKHIGVMLISPRHILQYVGTDILRAIDPDIHVNMTFKLHAQSEAKFLICSDVRFANEARMIANHGGLLIGISRACATPAPEAMATLHASEAGIPALLRDSADVVIHNEGTVEQLEAVVKKEVNKFLAHDATY